MHKIDSKLVKSALGLLQANELPENEVLAVFSSGDDYETKDYMVKHFQTEGDETESRTLFADLIEEAESKGDSFHYNVQLPSGATGIENRTDQTVYVNFGSSNAG